MNKFLFLFVFGVLYISAGVFSATVTNPNVNPVIDNSQQIAQMNAELTAKINLLDKKLDSYATRDDVINILTSHLIKVNEIMANFQIALTIYFIVIGLALLGVGYSVFFYFKSKGRL